MPIPERTAKEVNRALRDAIKANDAQKLAFALHCGANVMIGGSLLDPHEPLALAVKNAPKTGPFECIKMVLDAGAKADDVFAALLKGKYGLEGSHKENVALMMADYAVRDAGRSGRAPHLLMLAVREDMHRLVQYLCDIGVDPKSYDGVLEDYPLNKAGSGTMRNILLTAIDKTYNPPCDSADNVDLQADKNHASKLAMTEDLGNGDICVQVFDFDRRVMHTYYKNDTAISAPHETHFDDMSENTDMLRTAFNLHKSRGGIHDESVILPRQKTSVEIGNVKRGAHVHG